MIKRHILKRFFIFISFVVIVACSTTPLPETINIVPPSSDVPPEVAAFSGAWQGIFFGALNVTFVVEEINTQSANVIYSWGDSPGGPGGYQYATANVISGPSIEWIDRNQGKITYTMNRDLNSLEGIIHDSVENYTFKAQLKRVDLEQLLNK
ncbi:MAG: hypothetical protein Q7U10_11930 [Thermodesulfovibrionia bacterium]|nr:hypothetical protein [Thermodesulfovibrionia bacterium]